MAQLYFNNAHGTIAESVSSGATTLRVTDHVNFPSALADGDYFLLTAFAASSRYGERLEVVKVNALAVLEDGDLSLTVERGYELGAEVRSVGDRVEARLTARGLANMIGELRAYAESQAAGVMDAAPGTLDTLNELAAALGDDPNFATTMATQLGNKLDKADYTAADVLAKLKTVDSDNAGINASTLGGKAPDSFEPVGKSLEVLQSVGWGVNSLPTYPRDSLNDSPVGIPSGLYRVITTIADRLVSSLGATIIVKTYNPDYIELEYTVFGDAVYRRSWKDGAWAEGWTTNLRSTDVGTNAGDLLRVGDLGIVGAAPAAIDLGYAPDFNQIIDRNITVTTTADYANGPSIAPSVAGILDVKYRVYNNLVTQTFYPLTSYPSAVYRRNFHPSNVADAAWTVQYEGTNIVGTVRDTDGTPSGAVIERGTNSNGSYTKLADGTVFMSMTVKFPLVGSNESYILPSSLVPSIHNRISVTTNTATAGWEEYGDRFRWLANGRLATDARSINILGPDGRINGASTFLGTYGTADIIIMGRWK